MMNRIFLILVFIVSVCNVFARDYYVGGSGAADTNPGTATQPFATIQKAASVAVAGDIVKIRSGTYRETVVVANSGSAGSPIIFQPDQGAVVIVSGLNDLGAAGWTIHNGNIYKKSITLPVNGFHTGTSRVPENNLNATIFANQIFKDGEMQMEARWPKVSTFADLFDRNKFKQLTFEPTFLVDAGLPLPAPGLQGATLVSNGWFPTETRTITSHSGNQLSFAAIWNNTVTSKWTRRRYYVTGKLTLLTQAREWHYENGTLYFWQNGGGAPSGRLEYKARNWGFDIRNKSYITVAGLTFIGCDAVVGNAGSRNAVIDNIKATFMNHHVRHDVQEWQGVGMSKQFGIKLLGANSVIKDSELHSFGSSGIWLGPNCRAENNLIHDMGYVGNWANGISLWDRDGGQVITRNTVYRVGRSCFDFGYNWNGQHLNVEISYNDFSHYGMISADVGATYSWGQCDLTGLKYHHNWIHDNLSPGQPTVTTGGAQCGIYFDQATGPGVLHHNVTWNCGDSDVYHEVVNEHRTSGTILNFYNNTFATQTGGNPVSSYRTYITSPHDVQRNNIYRRRIVINWGASAGNIANSLLEGTNPQFVNSGQGGLAYRVATGSPAVNAGVVIPGITDGSVGAPDIGAYEVGGPAWVAGYTPVTLDPTANIAPVGSITAPANSATFTQGSAINITATASDENGTVTKVEFFDGTTKLGEDATSPYAFVWNNATAGTHTLTVKVTDNQNSVITSAPVSITVTAASGPPTVSITAPADDSQFSAGQAVTITAAASDTNGSITKVEFFDGAIKLGEDLVAPYTYVWNNSPAGSHSITAKATDNQTNVTTSAVISIIVTADAIPVVAITGPTSNASFIIGAPITITATATDANGTVSKVEFFDGTTKLGEDLTSPYSFPWGNAAAGTHSLTARATDNESNVSTSTAVVITVSNNASPIVLITAPSNNAQIAIGGAITITASATDANGSVSKVEFFNGTTKLGEDLTGPYGFIWSNAPAGTHSITAKATDNLGAVGTSAAISITVTPPPGEVVVDAGDDKIVTLPNNSLTLIPSVVASTPLEYNWVQVNGPNTVSMTQDTEQLSLSNLIEGEYLFELSVTDANGLKTADQVKVIVVTPSDEETASIPRFFSPNDDGNGDLWEWSNTEAYENSVLTIFNRSGQKIYEAESYNNTWDGKIDGQPLQAGDYYYVIQLADLSDIRGAVRIIR